jgi:hypothetical protein
MNESNIDEVHTSNVDILSISHFLIYFTIGLFLKNQYLLMFIISLLWEIFEYTISHTDYTRQFLIKHWVIPEKYWNEPFSNKFYDVIINMTGYSIGNMINL